MHRPSVFLKKHAITIYMLILLLETCQDPSTCFDILIQVQDRIIHSLRHHSNFQSQVVLLHVNLLLLKLSTALLLFTAQHKSRIDSPDVNSALSQNAPLSSTWHFSEPLIIFHCLDIALSER